MAQPSDWPNLSQRPLPRGVVPIAVVAALVIWSLYSAVFTVSAESVGVIQRLGTITSR